MLISVAGVYRNGRVELVENPSNLPEGSHVIVTFVGTSNIDLISQGINPEQAEALRTSMAVFSEDWNSPEMSVYDNYDAVRTQLK